MSVWAKHRFLKLTDERKTLNLLITEKSHRLRKASKNVPNWLLNTSESTSACLTALLYTLKNLHHLEIKPEIFAQKDFLCRNISETVSETALTIRYYIISHHYYIDDTQLYISAHLGITVPYSQWMWMCQNILQLKNNVKGICRIQRKKKSLFYFLFCRDKTKANKQTKTYSHIHC